MAKKVVGFINTDRLTLCVKVLLWIQVAVASVSILISYLEYGLLSDFLNGVYTSQEMAEADAEVNDLRRGLIKTISFLVSIVSAIFILRWIHRANSNARHLGAEHMEFTPGWSIGYYFVPFLHLWKPYQAMSELWRASNRPSDWKYQVVSWLLPIWWALWICSNLLGHTIMKFSKEATELSEFMDLNMMVQISNVIAIPLALVFMALVSSIHRMQVSQIEIQSSQRLVEPAELKVIE